MAQQEGKSKLPNLCVYTVLIGGYETLNEQPVAKDSYLPFICLTDDPTLTSETWEIRRIVPAFPADSVRSARLAKLLVHQFLPEFEGSLYIDNSVHLLKPPEALIEAEWQEGGMVLPGHSFRETLDGEFKAVLKLRFDDPNRVLEQHAHYCKTLPELLPGPVFWSAIMLRDHRASAVQRAMEIWALHVLRYSRRDQLSLPIALHLAGLEPKRLEWDNHVSPYHSWPHTLARKLEVRVWSRGFETKWKKLPQVLNAITSRRIAMKLRALANKIKALRQGSLPLHWLSPLALCVQQWKTRAPVTFSEKVRYKMARDASPLAVMFADKVQVRDYVRNTIGDEPLVACYGVYTRANEIPWATLPREFVIKVNHASGGVIVVADIDGAGELPAYASGWSRYIVHPDRLDQKRAAKLLDDWLGRTYGQWPQQTIERAYHGIERRIIAEECLAGEDGGGRFLPTTVMITCIHGVPAQCLLERRLADFDSTGRRRYLIEEWANVAREWNISPADAQRIIDWSRSLAGKADMVRVDWHLTPRGVHFNELTNYPAAGHALTGHASMSPQALNLQLGALWSVPKHYGKRRNWFSRRPQG